MKQQKQNGVATSESSIHQCRFERILKVTRKRGPYLLASTQDRHDEIDEGQRAEKTGLGQDLADKAMGLGE